MRKNIFTILLAMFVSTGNVHAVDDVFLEIDGLYYHLVEGETTASVMPKSYAYPYNENRNITEANIPSSITYKGQVYSIIRIDDNAFLGCSSLTSVTIPNSVTYIGYDAFAECTGLTSVEIPNSVTYIGYDAFADCTVLTSIEIPNSITSIGQGAFARCSSLTTVTIPNSVTYISDNSFEYCTSLTSVEIPNSVTSIGDDAFHGCTGMTSVEIPNSVTYIGRAAFADCTVLTSIEIPNSVRTIVMLAFAGCTSLTSVTIGNSVTSIYETAFNGCNSLTDIYATCGDLDRVKQLFNNDSRVKYAPSPYTMTVKSNGSGNVTISDYTSCDKTIQLTATANTGCYFAKWSDGDLNNPRTVQLTQDTTFTAEFAKNVYTITAISNNTEYGIATGGAQAEYLSEITLTAVPQTGHHFEYWQSGTTKYSTNPLNLSVTGDATYTAYFAPNVYTLTVIANSSQGYVTAPSQAEFLKEVTMTATPLTGYEFVQWHDGSKDNPRTIQLIQDTTFTAEFAKSKYTIATAVNDDARGTTSGDAVVEYLTSLQLIATANYGYHFDYWKSGTKTYTANPLNITATGNATYTAYFTPNIYNVSVYSNNSSLGTVSAPTQANYLNTITLSATPADGCHFVQWNDGKTDNPRYVEISRDTSFVAEFAITLSGTCGENLSWSYSEKKHTLTISGSGSMFSYTATTAPWRLLADNIYSVILPEGLTEISSNVFSNCQNLTSVVWNAVNCAAPSDAVNAPFYAIRSKINSFTFGERVKKVPAYLCFEMSALTSIALGSNVTNIGKHAFDGCEDLAALTCEASIPPTCGTDAFSGVSIFIPVSVPLSAIEKYQVAPVWKDFYTFSSIQAETKSVNEVTAEPTDNSVKMEWYAVAEAEIYTLVLFRNGEKFCEVSFNENGQLLGILFASSRNGSHYAQAATQTATGWQFTISSLESGTTYDYSVTAKKADDTPLYTKSGTFTTTGSPTALNEITNDQSPMTNKVIKDGKIFILRGDNIYTIQGQEVR